MRWPNPALAAIFNFDHEESNESSILFPKTSTASWSSPLLDDDIESLENFERSTCNLVELYIPNAVTYLVNTHDMLRNAPVGLQTTFREVLARSLFEAGTKEKLWHDSNGQLGAVLGPNVPVHILERDYPTWEQLVIAATDDLKRPVVKIRIQSQINVYLNK